MERFQGQPEADLAWDQFVRESWNGTLMHTRRFLAYHGDRFQDRSLLIRDDGETLLGLLPAAQHPSQPDEVWSHPGLSYGGVVQSGGLRGDRMIAALQAAARHYRELGYARLRYKAVPSFYERVPSADDRYALWRLGALRERCDVTSLIDIGERPRPSVRRRRCLRRALRAGVEIAAGGEQLAEAWSVLEDNLEQRHERQPVHTVREMADLLERFPGEIELRCGLLETRVAAMTVLIRTPTAVHTQYCAASPDGFAANALDLLLEDAIQEAASAGTRWFDFGISSEDGGRALNESLYRFKNEFGSGAGLHEFYTLELGA